MNLNARMYAPAPAIETLWRALFAQLLPAGMPLTWIDLPAPQPLEALWRRPDNAAVFMCGLPFALGRFEVQALAAPIPSPPAYQGQARYYSDFVVRVDSPFHRLEDTFGQRIAFTTPDSQSGFAAALEYLKPFATDAPLYREVIAPRITPRGNIMAVIEGLAEVAPIDGYVFDLLRRHEPLLTAQLRTVARTALTPNPLLVASAGVRVDELRQLLLDIHVRPELAGLRQELLLNRFGPVEVPAYRSLAERFATTRQVWRERPLARRVHVAFA